MTNLNSQNIFFNFSPYVRLHYFKLSLVKIEVRKIILNCYLEDKREGSKARGKGSTLEDFFFFLLIQMRDERGLSLKQKGKQTQEVFRR